jgi:SAM-dependent methyltransferase
MGKLILAGAMVALGVTWMGPASAEAQAVANKPDSGANQKLPPIECPLRKAGIDPTKLKPFEEVEEYIEFLERADRAQWQKPDEVVKALGLKGSEIVVDLGAGPGYFTFRLAKALPNGRVIAIDSQPEMARHVHRKVLSEGIRNIQAQVAKSDDDPGLSADADLVFVCDVLMHVKKRAEWLKAIHSQMKSGARLVLIDFKEGDLPEGPPEKIKVPKAEEIRLCKAAGFTLKEDRSDLLPYQEFLVFERP